MRLRRHHAATACAVVYMLVMSAYLFVRPSYDWDTLAYVAVALHMSGVPTDQLHAATYANVSAEIPLAAMDSLVGIVTPESLATTSSTTVLADTDFRKAVAADPQQFLAQLPFFSIKPVYPALMALVHGLTDQSLIDSGLLVSVAAFFGTGLLFYRWFTPWMAPFVAFGVMALLVLNPWLVTQARTIGPDILSIFVLLLGTYLALEGRPLAALAAFIVAIPIRPENILYLVVFALYLAAVYRRASLLAAIVAGLVVEFGIREAVNSYGWQTLFNYSFGNKRQALDTGAPKMGVMDYLRFYEGRLDRILMGQGEAPMFALIGFAALCLKAWNLRDKYVHLLFLAGIIGGCRMLILPTEAFRALLPCYMMVTVSLIQACAMAGATR